jgi:acyl-CoA thioesterase-1
LLVGMRIPPNYGPDYTEKFYAAFQAVAKTMHVPLVPFLLEGFAERRDMFQADGIHPGVAAQSLMLDNVWKQLQPILTRPAQKH